MSLWGKVLLPSSGEQSQKAKVSCADSAMWRASRTLRPNSCALTLPSPSMVKCTALSPHRYTSTSWAVQRQKYFCLIYTQKRHTAYGTPLSTIFFLCINTLTDWGLVLAPSSSTNISYDIPRLSVAEEATLPLCETLSAESWEKLQSSPSISILKYKQNKHVLRFYST